MSPTEIVKENLERLKKIRRPYSQITGQGSVAVERVRFVQYDFPVKELWLPAEFAATGFCRSIMALGMRRYIVEVMKTGYSRRLENLLYIEFCRERMKHDFEFWAYMCAKISPKGGGADISFSLNRAQREYYLPVLERLRTEGKPIDVILLKARQWGGSTLTQIYMLWIQLVHRKNWNSVICGDVESQSNIVCGMISKVISNYPSWASGGKKVETRPYEGSSKTRVISSSGCMYSVGSAQKPDSLRSQNISMAHLTEVGIWKATKGKKPEDLVQSIFGSVVSGPYTMKVLESTAKGVGNYFHRTWLSAKAGKNNFTPAFIPWFVIDLYSEKMEYKDYFGFIATMDEYEHFLFSIGATLEAIAWYRKKKTEITEEWRMCSEYPSTAEEAFQSTGRRFFPIRYVQNARSTCVEPSFFGEFHGDDDKGPNAFSHLEFRKMQNTKDGDGVLWVWCLPDAAEDYRDRYVVSVDIGGVGDDADYSSIKVLDRLPMCDGGVPEVVAEWHGHIEHDLLIWKAAQIAYAYGEALLVVESNTLETEGTEGDNFEYVLDEIVDYYPNLYSRTSSEQIRQGAPVKYGFHTNVSTKPLVLNFLKACMRDMLYIERCMDSTFEMDNFEIKEDGKTTGAVEGNHDDRVMSTAICVYVAYKMPLPSKVRKGDSVPCTRRVVSEATI